jgi:hypothetical protein
MRLSCCTAIVNREFKLLNNIRNNVQNVTIKERRARYALGGVVKHRFFPFRGIMFDVDPEFVRVFLE